MDGWAQKLDQLRSLVRGFSAAQRLALSVVSLVVLGVCGWLGYSSFNPPQAFLLGGKTFSKDELTRTLDAFKTAGLTQHKVEGQRISVPAAHADGYTAAAIAQKALPAQFAAEFDRMQSRVNVFTSSEQRRELLEEARKTRLAQILRAIPEIEDAVVEWDRPKSTSLFRPQNQLAAHVSVRPRDGHELTLELVQSLKQFVAGALAGAKPEDVTVVDMNTSRVYGRRTSEEAAADRLQSLEKQIADDATRQISRALQYIPHVLVSVNVEMLAEVDTEPSEESDDLEVVPIRRQVNRISSPKSGSNRSVATSIARVSLPKREFRIARTPHPLASASSEEEAQPDLENSLHKSIQVAIAIPDDFYSTLARRQGIAPGTTLVADSEFRAAVANIKMESQRDIRDKLARLLPSGTPPESISITSYTRLESPPESEVALRKHPLRTTNRFGDWAPLTGIILSSISGLWLLSRWILRTRRTSSSAFNSAASDNRPLSSHEMGPHENSTDQDGFLNAGTPLPELASPAPESELSGSAKAALNPYAAILAELAEREQDSVLGAPNHGGMFEFLCQLAPADLADFLREEHPQTIALVTSGLPPTRAAETLYALPEAQRWDVTQRISRLGQAAPDVCRDVAQSLALRLRERQAKIQDASSAAPSKSNDLRSTVRPRSGSRQQSTARTTGTDALSATERGPVSFEDLCVLDRGSFAAVLRAVDAKSFAVALFDRPEPFKQKFMSMLPRSVAAAISQQTYALGPLRLSDITASQDAIAGIIWGLSQQNMISLPPHLIRPRKV